MHVFNTKIIILFNLYIVLISFSKIILNYLFYINNMCIYIHIFPRFFYTYQDLRTLLSILISLVVPQFSWFFLSLVLSLSSSIILSFNPSIKPPVILCTFFYRNQCFSVFSYASSPSDIKLALSSNNTDVYYVFFYRMYQLNIYISKIYFEIFYCKARYISKYHPKNLLL